MWLVYDGTALSGVYIGWSSSETLAKYFGRYGSLAPDFSTEVFRRDPGRERTYDERDNPGIQMGRVFEISRDKTTISRSDYTGNKIICQRQDR